MEELRGGEMEGPSGDRRMVDGGAPSRRCIFAAGRSRDEELDSRASGIQKLLDSVF